MHENYPITDIEASSLRDKNLFKLYQKYFEGRICEHYIGLLEEAAEHLCFNPEDMIKSMRPAYAVVG